MFTTNPIEFKRGTVFQYIYEVPAEYADGYFKNWETSSHISIDGNRICILNTKWIIPDKTRHLFISLLDTTSIPLGFFEVDINFLSPDGVRINSPTLIYKCIQRPTNS